MKNQISVLVINIRGWDGVVDESVELFFVPGFTGWRVGDGEKGAVVVTRKGLF